jgi:eukaryotic translation initiation factor 2C
MDIKGNWAMYKEAAAQNRKKLPLDPSPLIIVILPTYAADIRKEVKQWSDTATGVPTQCVRQDKLFKANDQYCNNLALKSSLLSFLADIVLLTRLRNA